MKKLIVGVVCWTILAAACYMEVARNSIPDIEISGDARVLRKNGLLFFNDIPFSGYYLERDEEGGKKSRTTYIDGRAEGWAYGYYDNGDTSWKRYYHNGKKQGTHYSWHRNGRLRSVYHYRQDMFEGEQVTYFADGNRAQLQHYKDGHEEGTQQSWSQAGKLTSNYTVKNGKRYGIIGRTDCVSVYKH